ncbi:MAG: helix-turn-helix domain-containing protein [Methylocella sp.]|jgi:DNA-binding transcriptional MerR regulator
MMTKIELEQGLLRLGLSQTEGAQLLGVAPRTLRRWLEGEEIPGPAEQAVRAWIKLHDRKLPWRPDSAAIADDDQDQITGHREHAISLSDIIARVEARGGPQMPWVVDRQRSRATLGPMEVTFYTLANGAPSLANYTRKDKYPDVERDRSLIEDAAYCIAKEFTSEVTLVWGDRPWRSGVVSQKQETLPSKEAAIQRACAAMGAADFHDAFIMAGNQPLLDKNELRRECQRRKDRGAALKAVAEYVLRHSDAFATDGPRMLSPEQRQQQKQRIEIVARKIDDLAIPAERGEVNYGQFETLLGELHRLGFFPETSLVSAVAHSFP